MILMQFLTNPPNETDKIARSTYAAKILLDQLSENIILLKIKFGEETCQIFSFTTCIDYIPPEYHRRVSKTTLEKEICVFNMEECTWVKIPISCIISFEYAQDNTELKKRLIK